MNHQHVEEAGHAYRVRPALRAGGATHALYYTSWLGPRCGGGQHMGWRDTARAAGTVTGRKTNFARIMLSPDHAHRKLDLNAARTLPAARDAFGRTIGRTEAADRKHLRPSAEQAILRAESERAELPPAAKRARLAHAHVRARAHACEDAREALAASAPRLWAGWGGRTGRTAWRLCLREVRRELAPEKPFAEYSSRVASPQDAPCDAADRAEHAPASAAAVSMPMPLVAPVTSAVLPSRSPPMAAPGALESVPGAVSAARWHGPNRRDTGAGRAIGAFDCCGVARANCGEATARGEGPVKRAAAPGRWPPVA
eukprot:365743-Chlamydomonas_euryale.AAC.23